MACHRGSEGNPLKPRTVLQNLLCFVSECSAGAKPMRRRELMALVGGAALAGPLTGRAQQPERVRRIGVLVDDESLGHMNMNMFVQGLAELGWTEGRNIQIDHRMHRAVSAALNDAAVELVALKPDVILAKTTQEVKAVLEQTHAVPIVFAMCADPVGDGLVGNFARPRGNVTGFSSFEPGLGGKWLELLKDMVPNVTRVAVIAHPDESKEAVTGLLLATEPAAHSLGIEVSIIPGNPVASTSYSDSIIKLLRAIDGFALKANGGLIMFPGTYTTILYHYQSLWLAERHRLPTIYPSKDYVSSGGLMSYGVDPADNFRRAASYVDRVLRGTKPNELPVQAPIRFELAVNLSTAKELGLTVPQSILVRANEVIE
jgi:ABC-type uncharacterized transport system substrate-binding protein